MKKLLHYKSQSIFFIKCDLKMKLTALLTLSAILIGDANESYSQKGITLNVVNESVASVIEGIEATTAYNLVCNTRDVDLDRRGNEGTQGARIKQVLEELSAETRTQYKRKK